MPMFLPDCCLDAAISPAARSRGIRVEFCQSADLSVPETAYLTLPFMLSAISPAHTEDRALLATFPAIKRVPTALLGTRREHGRIVLPGVLKVCLSRQGWTPQGRRVA